MGKSINVQNIRLAEVTVTDNGNGTRTFSFGTPELVAGAMKINRVPQVAEAEMYEDGKLSEQISQLISHNLAADIGRLPQKWRAWINGLTIVNGVQSDKGPCTPKPFSMGWEVEHIKSGVVTKELIWFIYCLAKPIEDTDEERSKDIKISNDTVNIVAFKLDEFEGRAYTIIDTINSSVTAQMQTDFFTKVQTSDTISGAGTKVAAVTATPVSGTTFATTQSVTLACATSGASIYYTTDGTVPTLGAALYSTAISLSATTTIKAIAVKATMANSEVATFTYTKS